MSGVAALFNVPTTPDELSSWASSHASHHRDINRRLFEIVGVTLDEFVLEPINPNDIGTWTYQHQQMHFQMDAFLGINGYDLTGVDFTNRDILTGWTTLHSNEHYQAANILEIG